MGLTHEEVIAILENDRPNLAAVLKGCVSGKAIEWPMMRPGLIGLVNDLTAAREQQAHWCSANIELGRKLEACQRKVQELEYINTLKNTTTNETN